MIYKITYPNGKIYIGQDRTDDCNYFGSADSHSIAADFSPQALSDFTVRKQILRRIHNVTIKALNVAEREYIDLFHSNRQHIGYNRTGIARMHRRTLFKEDA